MGNIALKAIRQLAYYTSSHKSSEFHVSSGSAIFNRHLQTFTLQERQLNTGFSGGSYRLS